MDLHPRTVGSLTTTPESHAWFRAVHPRHYATALNASQTMWWPSRFNAGRRALSPFATLYLAENQQVALFEVQALFGTPARVVPNPVNPWVVFGVTVSLTRVADLTVAPSIRLLRTSAQELTGDWRGYRIRRPPGRPRGRAPTQKLGQALYDSGQFEGFRTLSARVTGAMILVIFPSRLRSGSFVEFSDPAGARTYRIDDTWTPESEQQAIKDAGFTP